MSQNERAKPYRSEPYMLQSTTCATICEDRTVLSPVTEGTAAKYLRTMKGAEANTGIRARLWLLPDHSFPVRDCYRLHPAAHAQSAIEARQQVLDRLFGKMKPGGDVPVALAGVQQTQ